MKYKFLMLLIACVLFSTQTKAFEYHGIKSGMTENEVSKSLEALGVSYQGGALVRIDSDKGLSGVTFSPSNMFLKYDQKGRLYRLSLSYIPIGEPFEGVNVGAFITAFMKKYGVELQKERIAYKAEFLDKKLYENYFDALVKEYMPKF